MNGLHTQKQWQFQRDMWNQNISLISHQAFKFSNKVKLERVLKDKWDK